jgi:hypothetical protein
MTQEEIGDWIENSHCSFARRSTLHFQKEPHSYDSPKLTQKNDVDPANPDISQKICFTLCFPSVPPSWLNSPNNFNDSVALLAVDRGCPEDFHLVQVYYELLRWATLCFRSEKSCEFSTYPQHKTDGIVVSWWTGRWVSCFADPAFP